MLSILPRLTVTYSQYCLDMKHKEWVVPYMVWVMGWSSTLVGILAVLLSMTLGTCPMARAVTHATQLFMFDDLQTDNSVAIWNTIREVVLYLPQSAKNIKQVGASRLWTSRKEHFFKTCVCWPSTNPLPPPYTDCLSMATLDFNAHPCAPYHPATNGWVKRPLKVLHRFTGKQKVYWYSGFYIDLNLDQDIDLVTLNQYEKYDWLDWNTDAVVLEAVLYDSSTLCIIYVQMGFERDSSHTWRSTIWAWTVCEICWKSNTRINYLLQLAMVLHMVTLVVDFPWSRLKHFSFRKLTSPACWWPGKTLFLNLVVLIFFLAVVVTEHTLYHRMVQVWQVPFIGKSVFPSVIALGITHLTDYYTFLLVILAMLQAYQLCARTFSELSSAVVRLVRLLAIVAVIVAPFGVALHQLGVSVANLSTLEDSLLAVTAAYLGEIDVTGLVATTQITGLVLFLLLFIVFTLLLFPFLVEVLTDRPDLSKNSNPRSLQQRQDFSDQLATVISMQLPK